jgi:hypothetical protein
VFTGKRKWDLPGWMHSTLQSIDQHLCWEYGPAVNKKGHRLVITPESQRHLRPLVNTILDRAPDLPGWEFYPYRLAEDLEMAQATVEGRTGGSLDGVAVELKKGEGNRVDLLFRSSHTEGDEDEEATNIAFVATESLLGERNLDHWVGAIEVADLPSRGKAKHAIPLARLKDTFDALVGSIRDSMPPRPIVELPHDDQWAMIQLEPEPADDYAGQDDLIVATTRDVELWKATHANRMPFFSQRFSRCKETFVYVKIDGSSRTRGKEADERGAIEDALDDKLVADKLGIHTGGGTGICYSYIDLALTDLERGVDCVRRVLQKLKVPKRSWIQFFDADLAAEWVGVYPETPEPPMAVEE